MYTQLLEHQCCRTDKLFSKHFYRTGRMEILILFIHRRLQGAQPEATEIVIFSVED